MSARLVITVVWDGLRPDFVTPQATPTLFALASAGVWFGASHCVYPSETRVNAAALATGCTPGRTGITANTIDYPGLGGAVNTGDHTQLARLEAADPPLLRAPWVAQAVAAAGGEMVVASSGSPGAALLQNPLPDGVTVNIALLRPESVAETVRRHCGPTPPDARPATARSDWVTAALLDVLLPQRLLPALQRGRPALAHWWLTDPDHTAHHAGLGAPDTVRSLGENDARLGALMARLESLGLLAQTDVLLTSDHGFSTLGPTSGPLAGPAGSFARHLVEAGLRAGPAGDDLVSNGIGGGSISLHPSAAGRAPVVVEWLQRQPWCGAILARDGGPAAGLPGTLPLSLAWNGHVGPRAPDIRFGRAWTDEPNGAGVPGTVFGADRAGATHGSLSPYDMRNSLFAWGPSFKQGLRSDVPVGIVDVAPTVRHLLGLPAVEADGRVLAEALAGGPHPDQVPVKRAVHEAAVAWQGGGFRQRLRRAAVGATSYVEGVDAERD